MRTPTVTNIATYSLLATVAAGSLVLPSNLLQPQRSSAAPPMNGATTLQLNTIVRDFNKGTPADFGSGASGGSGHYAGNVMTDLGPNGTPAFVGLDAVPLTDFNIVNGALIPQKPFAAMVTVIGAAINSGTYDRPVTTRAIVNSTAIDPFGNFNKAVASNVNKAGNPRSYILPYTYAAGTPVHISGSSWAKTGSSGSGGGWTVESNWSVHHSYSTTNNSKYIKVLKNGDSAPNTAGFLGQLSAKQFLAPYINTQTQKVTLKSNQVIYLFELGTTDTTDPAADFQDLVMLVTLGENANYLATLDAYGNGGSQSSNPKGYKVTTEWRDSAGRAIPPAMFGTMPGDVAGSKGSASTGGIDSSASFDQWFTDVMGTNLSIQHPLTLTRNNGVWEYTDNDFHPIDNMLLGNEGKAHNHYFTMNFGVDFTHRAGEHRFIEFQGDDDVWVYVDGKLVMDLGGINPGVKQYLDVDRIPGLSDGAQHHIEFFYAQRQESTATFRLRTNLDLGEGTTEQYTVSGSHD